MKLLEHVVHFVVSFLVSFLILVTLRTWTYNEGIIAREKTHVTMRGKVLYIVLI